MPKRMAGINAFAPAKALGLGLLLAGVNPKNLLLFVIVGSLTIAAPVVFYLAGGDRAKIRLDAAKDWLAVYDDAVTRPEPGGHDAKGAPGLRGSSPPEVTR